MRIHEGNETPTEKLLSPREGYDLAAPYYDSWYWTEFWKHNEMPLVTAILNRLTPRDALDAGSGTGAYRFQLEARGSNTMAIDVSGKMLEVQARKGMTAGPQAKARLVVGDIKAMPPEWSERFDCAICARVLAHIDNCLLAVRELGRVVKQGGRLIITDIDPEHEYRHVRISNGSIRSLIQVFKHDHHELKAVFEASGLRIKSFRRLILGDLLWLPPEDKFAKIYRSPRTPIFFIYDLIKRF